MSVLEDPAYEWVTEDGSDFTALASRPSKHVPPTASSLAAAVTARLHGFDRDDRPQLTELTDIPNEIVTARTTVSLSSTHVGATVVVVCERGDIRLPIVLGILQGTSSALRGTATPSPQVSVQADDDRIVLEANREIVLKCGDASITLTRAGKVIIDGRHVVSRSSGYNRIKGAAVDIN